MINRKLRAMLFTLSFLGAPFMKVMPFTWAPVGDGVDSEGYATTGGLYNYGDLIEETPGDFNSSFASTAADCTLEVYGTLRDPNSTIGDDGLPTEEFLDTDGNPVFSSLKIDGDVRLDARCCDGCDMTININTDVIFEPYTDSAGVSQIEGATTGVFAGSDGLCYSQIYFNTEAGRSICVNVDNNLEFRGRTVDPATQDFTDMIVTFNGAGRVIFKLADGTAVLFNGQIDDTTPILVDINGNETLPIALNETGEEVESCVFNASAAGTKVYITMDQTEDQAITCGQHKVTFMRKRRSDEVTIVDCSCPQSCPAVRSPKEDKSSATKSSAASRACPAPCPDCPCECVCQPCCPTTAPCDIAPELRVMVYVGHNSLITYLSDNLTGLQDTSGCFCTGGYGSVAFDPSNSGEDGTGRMVLMIKGAYDISFAPDETEGTLIARYPFNDGGVVIAGHFVECDKQDVDHFTPELVRTTVDYSTPAGVQAIFAVCDIVCDLDAIVNRPASERRGLLVINDVANHGKLACDPYWDLYQEPFDQLTGTGCVGALYAYSNPNKFTKDAFTCSTSEAGTTLPAIPLNVRRGFVLGVNGLIDVCHDMFLDYVAGSCNKVDDLAACCYDPCSIKKRNPSALIVDGLDPRLFCKPGCGFLFTGNPYTCATSEFEAANPFTQGDAVRHAMIHLRGNGSVYLRSSVSSVDCYMYNYWFEYDGDFTHGETGTPAPELDPALDYIKHLSVGAFQSSNIGNPNCPDIIVCAEKSAYDGFALSGNTQTEIEPCGGEHVLDVECDLSVCSVANNTIRIDSHTACGQTDCGDFRDYGCVVDRSGVIKMLSVVVDHAGREIYFDENNQPVLVNRPIFASGSIETDCYDFQPGVPLKLNEKIYCRYNSPGIYLNANMSLYESHLIHSDATKIVDGVPSNSEPAITGGEKLYYSLTQLPESIVDIACGTTGEPAPAVGCDPNRYRFPEIRLNNSTVHLHESLASTGMRWVVTDRPDVVCINDTFELGGTNVSAIKFYDHGDCWDTLLTSWGRIFMLGSNLNKMSGFEKVTVLECLECERPCTNDILQSAYLNVFRGRSPANTSGDLPSDIRLLLQNGNQFNDGVPADLYDLERAQHLLILGMTDLGKSNVHIGWPTITGFDQVFPHVYPYPGDALINTPDDAFAFSLDGDIYSQAVLRVDGKIITFGAFDSKGNARKVPFKGSDETGVFYIDHGGRLDITADTVTHELDIVGNASLRDIIPAELVVDTIVGQRVWSDFDASGEVRNTALTGCIDLPHDQVTFINNYAIQPYNFTTAMFDAGRAAGNEGWVRLPYINTHRGPSFDKTGGEEIAIAWHNRDCEGYPNMVPVKGRAQKYLTRTTESIGAPKDRPVDLLYVGPGDDVTQVQVAGATQADPFHLAVRGATTTPDTAWVREFVTLKTQTNLHHEHFIGEGAHAVLFVQNGGHVGLGSRSWNDHSLNAWSLLGKDYVTVCPLGDGVVDVNSNLLVTDRLPLICSSDFKAHRLTFYSEEPREIRVPANGELDLSSFGQGLAVGQHQEIAFAGQLRLVLEQGATIRFPDTTSGDGVVLYFNDESQLVFEGPQSRQGRRPNYANVVAADQDRTKIVGHGQIWLNKDATLEVNGNAAVAVQTDDLSVSTDIVISIQRQAQFNIGTAQVTGGSFQVGNRTNLGSGHSINFELALNGEEATFRIGRSGFFGIGAGTINKEGTMNGTASATNNPVLVNGVAVLGEDGRPVFTPDTTNAWQIGALSNVNVVFFDISNGVFDHSFIVDGSDRNASLFAFGPMVDASVNLGGSDSAIVRGGGNVMLVPAGTTTFKANVWDFDGLLTLGERYSTMSSAPMLRDRGTYNANNKTAQFFNFTSGTDLYNFFATTALKDQDKPKVSVSETQEELTAVFVNPTAKYTTGNTISRIENPSTVQDGANVEETVNIGALNAATGIDGNPESFTVLNQ